MPFIKFSFIYNLFNL